MNYLYDLCFDFVLNGKNYLLSLYSFNPSPLPPPQPTHAPPPPKSLNIFPPLPTLNPLSKLPMRTGDLKICYVQAGLCGVRILICYVSDVKKFLCQKYIVICFMLFIYCYYTVHIHVCYQRARLVYISLMHILYVYYFHL